MNWIFRLILNRYRSRLEKRIDPNSFDAELSRKLDAVQVLLDR